MIHWIHWYLHINFFVQETSTSCSNDFVSY